MAKPDTITRSVFVKQYMEQCGLTYQKACEVYDCMVATLQDAVVNGCKVNFGRLGSLTPQWMPARAVNMGFERGPGNMVNKRQRQFFLGRRIKYKFTIYREFSRTHNINWFNQPDGEPSVDEQSDS